MNNFDEWSQIISTYLKSEADLLTTMAKHDVDFDAPRDAFIREVLELFLPSSYAIGSGKVVDSQGQSSDKLDLVIYRRDFPRLNLPGSSDRFLYESVLATVEVRPKLIRKTLFDALDTCASLAELNPDISEAALANLAEKNHLSRNSKGNYVHEDPLLTARFNLVGRPPSFIYGFNGFKTSYTHLAENIEVWIDNRRQANLDVEMKNFPSVIATQGCFGCRNAAPLSAKNNHLFGIGVDDAPIRLIILNLLYALNRRLRVTTDGYGLKPGLDSYLKDMKPPNVQYTTGRATNAVIRTGVVAEQAIESLIDEEPDENIIEDQVTEQKLVENNIEEVPDTIADEIPDVPVEDTSSVEKQLPDPVEEISVDSFSDAVFEAIPSAGAVIADVTKDESISLDAFSELQPDTSGIEAEFVQTATEDDFVDPLIDTGMVEAAANVESKEVVVEEEAYDPFAEMELVDPDTEELEDGNEDDGSETLNMMEQSAEDDELADTVKLAAEEAESEDEFAKTVIMSATDLDANPELNTPDSEPDFTSTPLAAPRLNPG